LVTSPEDTVGPSVTLGKLTGKKLFDFSEEAGKGGKKAILAQKKHEISFD